MRMKHDPKVEELRALPAFANLDAQQLADIAALTERVTLPAGAVLTREGTPGREAFLVLSGEAEVAVGDEVIEVVGRGEFVGEMALLDRGLRSATITAREPMEVLVFSVPGFATFMSRAWAARRVAKQLAERVRILDHARA